MDDLIRLDQQEPVGDLDRQLLPAFRPVRQQLQEAIQFPAGGCGGPRSERRTAAGRGRRRWSGAPLPPASARSRPRSPRRHGRRAGRTRSRTRAGCPAASATRRATSKPGQPRHLDVEHDQVGVLSITCSASTPLPAWPTTSTPPISPSRKHTSSRASCSSSTTTGPMRRRSPSCRNPRRHDQLRDHDPRAGAFAGNAIELQLVVRAVDHPQPLVDVAEPDAAGLHPLDVSRAGRPRRCRSRR